MASQFKVFNSLTKSEIPFVPIQKNRIGWYACGPTVYDDAHLGHARNYVSTDIIRRILQDYFKYEVTFVMNITDVDDKIILAARQQHLLSQWLLKHTEVDQEVREATTEALAAYVQKNLPCFSSLPTPVQFEQHATRVYGHVLRGQSIANDGSSPGDKEAKTKMHLKTASSAAEALADSSTSMQVFVSKASGVLLPYIDSLEKHTVSGKDHAIFTKLTKRYEQRFFDDMRSLNVRPPDKITRVTEYGPQIVDFVKKIQQNGFAYEHEGSVYYDVKAWEKGGGVYARLKPENRNDTELQQDGEGSLSEKKTGFKRSGADFALWKASKEGEPSWESPWGEGRPGWHIECSAMASDVLGKQFDIHSGGIDLAFPHHDNELAQSEAYFAEKGCKNEQWVNYFLHMGHLSIQGSKMSKSLKNFTTIREALEKGDWNPRRLRIVFLQGAWRNGLEITSKVVDEAKNWEDKVSNFFIKVRDIQRTSSESAASNVTNGHSLASLTLASPETDAGKDSALYKAFYGAAATPENKATPGAKTMFDDAIRDSFDTPKAMEVLKNLITAYNSEKQVPSLSLAIGRWISDVVVMFGLDTDHEETQIGWSRDVEIPEEAKAFVYPLSELRDLVRQQAKAGDINVPALRKKMSEAAPADARSEPYAKAQSDFQDKLVELAGSESTPPKDFLAESDRLRDDVLWNLGIYLEDRDATDQPALVRPLSESVRQEREDREAIAVARAAAKAKAQADKAAVDQERFNKGQLSHLDMFRTSEYSAWDAEGLPTHDLEGKEVAKSRTKKLKKEWERQKKLHEAWKDAQGDQGS